MRWTHATRALAPAPPSRSFIPLRQAKMRVRDHSMRYLVIQEALTPLEMSHKRVSIDFRP